VDETGVDAGPRCANEARSPGPVPAKLATESAAKLPDPILFSRVRFWQAAQMNLSGFETQ
jgi:hypothetical protein